MIDETLTQNSPLMLSSTWKEAAYTSEKKKKKTQRITVMTVLKTVT